MVSRHKTQDNHCSYGQPLCVKLLRDFTYKYPKYPIQLVSRVIQIEAAQLIALSGCKQTPLMAMPGVQCMLQQAVCCDM